MARFAPNSCFLKRWLPFLSMPFNAVPGSRSLAPLPGHSKASAQAPCHPASQGSVVSLFDIKAQLGGILLLHAKLRN